MMTYTITELVYVWNQAAGLYYVLRILGNYQCKKEILI